MRDIQGEADKRNTILNKVGCRKMSCIVNHDSYREWADVSAYISLSAVQRGAHMSRFVEIFENTSPQGLSQSTGMLNHYLDQLCKRHEVEESFVKMKFNYPYTQIAPESNLPSIRKIPMYLEGERREDSYVYYFRVKLHVTSLCPCSKEISEYGAHNQRTLIDTRCRFHEDIDFTEFLDCINLGSAPIIELLKRPDEKSVTEEAYENPKFCEDIARDVSIAINEFSGIDNYSIIVESLESIHDHTALAIIDQFKFD